jgi:hypothetical protein
MPTEHAVGRHEGDSLDEGLRDQHAVERIAMVSWKFGHPERVASPSGSARHS